MAGSFISGDDIYKYFHIALIRLAHGVLPGEATAEPACTTARKVAVDELLVLVGSEPRACVRRATDSRGNEMSA